MDSDRMNGIFSSRRLRVTVSVIALLSLNVQPAAAQFGGKGGSDALNVCATERAPLIKLETDYKELKRSKLTAALGEGLRQGAGVLVKGVMSGGIPMPGGRGGGGFGGALGGVGGLMGAAAGMAQQRQAAPTGQPAASPGQLFGPDLLSGASGLQIPGISGGSFGGGDSMKAYDALAVLVAIVATAEAYAQLKEQEAGGDLKKASFNIDQDAARQLGVSREIVTDGNALVDCRSRQLTDINTRLAGASNDKDRKSIRKERTDLTSALKKDIDLTGGVVDQHTGMAKTFTQGRAMTDGSSEAEVLGGQAPAYAPAPATTRLSMPVKGGGDSMAPPQMRAQQGQTQVAAAPALIALKATVVRAAPVASADVLMNFPAGREVKPKTAQADGGWWEIDVAGQSGYIRAADLGPPGSPLQTQAVAPAAKGKAAAGRQVAKAAPPPPPVVQGPTNIRAYNQTVIAARDQGKGRLSSLMTDIQTSQRRESVLYAWLSKLGLG